MTKKAELKIILQGICKLRSEIELLSIKLLPTVKLRKEEQNLSILEKKKILFQRKEFVDLFNRLQGMYSMIGQESKSFIKVL
jgi:hypothetical protein